MTSAKNRIITCVGPIQLISAIAALRTHEQSLRNKEQYNNILVFYGLSVQSLQLQHSLDTLTKIANLLITVHKIICIDIEKIQEVYNSRIRLDGDRIIKKPLQDIFNINKAAEVWVNSDFDHGNKIIVSYFKSAKIICYGDGPSIFFTGKCEFFFNQAPVLENNIPQLSLKQRLVHLKRSIKAEASKWKGTTIDLLPVRFDKGYFLFSQSFGEMPWFPYEQISARTYRNIIEEAATKIHTASLSATLQMLVPGKLVILMTTNMSEAGRMTLADEIKGYIRLISQVADAGTTILIKPHPRDSQAKADQLIKAMNEIYGQVIYMNQPDAQYYPFEIFVHKLITHIYKDLQTFVENVHIFTTSTSCMTLAKLYSIRSYIGFGDEFVKTHFFDHLVESRLQHDKTLNNIVEALIKSPQIV